MPSGWAETKLSSRHGDEQHAVVPQPGAPFIGTSRSKSADCERAPTGLRGGQGSKGYGRLDHLISEGFPRALAKRLTRKRVRSNDVAGGADVVPPSAKKAKSVFEAKDLSVIIRMSPEGGNEGIITDITVGETVTVCCGERTVEYNTWGEMVKDVTDRLLQDHPHQVLGKSMKLQVEDMKGALKVRQQTLGEVSDIMGITASQVKSASSYVGEICKGEKSKDMTGKLLYLVVSFILFKVCSNYDDTETAMTAFKTKYGIHDSDVGGGGGGGGQDPFAGLPDLTRTLAEARKWEFKVTLATIKNEKDVTKKWIGTEHVTITDAVWEYVTEHRSNARVAAIYEAGKEALLTIITEKNKNWFTQSGRTSAANRLVTERKEELRAEVAASEKEDDL